MTSPSDSADDPSLEDEDDFPDGEDLDFATEHERRFAILDYLLNRLEQEPMLEELYALAERLNEAEEETIPEYEEFEGRAIAFMSEGRSPEDLAGLSLGVGSPETLEGLRRRLTFFYLLAVVDEDAESRDQAFEMARYFSAQASSDFDAAVETLDSALTHYEDLFMADYLEMTEDPDGEAHDHDEHDHGDGDDHSHAPDGSTESS